MCGSVAVEDAIRTVGVDDVLKVGPGDVQATDLAGGVVQVSEAVEEPLDLRNRCLLVQGVEMPIGMREFVFKSQTALYKLTTSIALQVSHVR